MREVVTFVDTFGLFYLRVSMIILYLMTPVTFGETHLLHCSEVLDLSNLLLQPVQATEDLFCRPTILLEDTDDLALHRK